MNWPYVHLLLNHFPVIGSIMTFLVLTHGMFKGNQEIIRLSMMLLVFLALITIAASFSGDQAADVVKHLPGVTKSYIQHHDRAGMFSMDVMEVLGIASLAGLWLFRKDSHIPRRFVNGVLILSLAVIVLTAWTANLGGQIRHIETRPGFKLPISGE